MFLVLLSQILFYLSIYLKDFFVHLRSFSHSYTMNGWRAKNHSRSAKCNKQTLRLILSETGGRS